METHKTGPLDEATTFDLEKARGKITTITDQMVDLFCERQKVMREIAEAKNGSGDTNLPIYLPQREQELISRYQRTAEENNVDPNMMGMLMSMLMSAAKFAQMEILNRKTILDVERPSKTLLRGNLMSLTAEVAATYGKYDEQAEGTHIECVRERQLLENLTDLRQGNIAINLGCADGTHVTDIIRKKFKRVIGYDLSPDMITCAKKKYPDCEFHVHDLDENIPIEDASVDLVVANFGAASEVCVNLWQEMSRVLQPGGCAYLSFYNKDALVTRWWTPWSNSFKITINPHNDTIMVPLATEDGSEKVFWIHGKSITEREVYANAQSYNLEVSRIESSSPLWDDKPPEFFKHDGAVDAAMKYEAAHTHIPPFLGQYLRVVIKKNEE